jgi:ParB family chromosome partitioning protein
MAKKAALKTAGISMAGFQPRPKVFDGQTPAPSPASALQGAAPGPAPGPLAGEAPREPVRPFTGVGSVMAAITREAEISQELVGVQARLQAATAKLTDYQDAVLVRAIDPRAVRRSQWANRVEAEFTTADFQQLKDEIAHAGGNVQPIKVRAIPGAPAVFDGQTPTHEIVFGHRRHQACLELGMPVNALLVDDMDDKSLFEAMDRENRGRKNLSPWEQGRMYDQAIRQGLYPSLRRLSESLGVNVSDASRAVQLAKLPREIVAAFASPLDLQVRWSKPLGDALQRDPEGVLQRARECAALAGPRHPGDVVARLVGLPAQQAAQELVIMSGKKRLAVLRADAKGRAVVEIEPGVLPPDRREELAATLKDFLRARPSD